MAETRAGYNPELSYGSHIFQDLVEAQILYMAVFPGNKTVHFRPDLLKQAPDLISGIPGGQELKGIVCLADVSERNCELYHDLILRKTKIPSAPSLKRNYRTFTPFRRTPPT